MTVGEATDCKAYDALIDLPERAPDALLADKGYDADAIRADLAKRNIEAVIPGRSNRRVKIEHDRALYKLRNRIERMFGQLKINRAITTRYDQLANGFLGMNHFATASYWFKFVHEDLFLEAVERMVAIDAAWIPEGDGSLYLRPFMFASEAFLGVKPASKYTFCVIASPVGSYFKGGKKALSLWVSDHLNRAGPGGTGAAKCGGNYAASLMAQDMRANMGVIKSSFSMLSSIDG